MDQADRQRILDKALTRLRMRHEAGDLTDARFEELQARALEWEQREGRRQANESAASTVSAEIPEMDAKDLETVAETIGAGVTRFVEFIGDLDFDFDFDFDFD